MGVSLKTENEEYAGKDYADMAQRRRAARCPASGGARGDQGFTGTCPQDYRWRSSRVALRPLRTHGPKLDITMWLLRCSVFRETPMA